MTEDDDSPTYTVSLRHVGGQPGLVFALLRRALGATPAEVKVLMAAPDSVVVARGPRMLVEPVFRRFRAAGADVEMTPHSEC